MSEVQNLQPGEPLINANICLEGAEKTMPFLGPSRFLAKLEMHYYEKLCIISKRQLLLVCLVFAILSEITKHWIMILRNGFGCTVAVASSLSPGVVDYYSW